MRRCSMISAEIDLPLRTGQLCGACVIRITRIARLRGRKRFQRDAARTWLRPKSRLRGDARRGGEERIRAAIAQRITALARRGRGSRRRALRSRSHPPERIDAGKRPKRKRTPAEAGVRGSRLAIVSCRGRRMRGRVLRCCAYGVASVAASALAMPVPMVGFWVEANGEAVLLMICSTCAGLRSGLGLDCISATMPATNGAAIEVPL